MASPRCSASCAPTCWPTAGGSRSAAARRTRAAPPNRPWAEVVRALAAETDPGRFGGPLQPLLSDDAPADSSDALLGRFRLHRAVREWLSSLDDRPLAILFDDVHRADGETRALLASVLDQGLANRTLFVLAYRPETDADLDELRATVARYHPTRVRLAGLDGDEVAELIETVTGSRARSVAWSARLPPGPTATRSISRRVPGCSLSEGELVATSQVPEGVADVLRRRLARLPEESVSILRLASVIGRDVDVALLIRAAEVGRGRRARGARGRPDQRPAGRARTRCGAVLAPARARDPLCRRAEPAPRALACARGERGRRAVPQRSHRAGAPRRARRDRGHRR